MLSTLDIKRIAKELAREVCAQCGGEPQPLPTGEMSQLISRKDAAKVLGVSVQTVAKLIKDGVLEHVKVERRVLVKKDSIGAYIERSTPGAGVGGAR
jgi:excisionase family DNA binding protein